MNNTKRQDETKLYAGSDFRHSIYRWTNIQFKYKRVIEHFTYEYLLRWQKTLMP